MRSPELWSSTPIRIRACSKKVGILPISPLHKSLPTASPVLSCCRDSSEYEEGLNWKAMESEPLGTALWQWQRWLVHIYCSLITLGGRTALSHVPHNAPQVPVRVGPVLILSLTYYISTSFLPLPHFLTPSLVLPGMNTYIPVFVPGFPQDKASHTRPCRVTRARVLWGWALAFASPSAGAGFLTVGTLWQPGWFLPFPRLVLLTNA